MDGAVQASHSMDRVCGMPCVAVKGDHQDSHWDPISQSVARQDQLACLPHLLTSMPWGCPGSRALCAGTVHWSRFQE